MTAPLVQETLARLKRVKRVGDGWTALCPVPAHNDRNPSLTIKEGREGRVLLKCHAGCTLQEITTALGVGRVTPITSAASHSGAGRTIDRVYDYRDEHGALRFQVVRYHPKDFRQRRPDGVGGWAWDTNGVRRVPYRLPELLAGVRAGRTLFLVEGEKDADRLAELGEVATTFAGGASQRLPDDAARYFAGADVVVIPDNDDPGRGFASRVAATLRGAARRVRVLPLPGVPEKGDTSDWLDAGGTAEALQRLVEAASELVATSTPPEAPARRERPAPRFLTDLAHDESFLAPPIAVLPTLALRGRATLLSAREKLGKSTLVGELVARLSRGEPFLDGTLMEPGVCLWYALDEPPADAVRRLIAYGATPSRIALQFERPTPEQLVAEIALTGARLVVFDTLTELGRGLLENDRDAQAVGVFMRPYVEAARTTDAAILFLHHTSKAGTEYRGSVQLGAVVDVIATLRRHNSALAEEPDDDTGDGADDGRRILDVRGRGVRALHRLSFAGGRYSLADKPMPLRERVLRLLDDGGQSANGVHEALGGRKVKVLDECRAMRSDGLLLYVEHTYQLSPRGRALLASLDPTRGAGTTTGTASGTGGPSVTIRTEPAGTQTETVRELPADEQRSAVVPELFSQEGTREPVDDVPPLAECRVCGKGISAELTDQLCVRCRRAQRESKEAA